jgi:hypothetical protein
VRDEDTLEDYFNHYIHSHRRRVLARSRPNQPTNVMPISRPATPGPSPVGPMSLFKKAPRPVVESTPAIETTEAASTSRKERTSSPDGSDPDGDIDLVDAEEMETEVEEVILVRKLGSLISLRDRRVKVLKELELVSRSMNTRRGPPS